MFVILVFLSLKTKGMLGVSLHVVAGSFHPVAEACSAHQLGPKEFLHTVVSTCSSANGAAVQCCFIISVSRPLKCKGTAAFILTRGDSSSRQLPVMALGS